MSKRTSKQLRMPGHDAPHGHSNVDRRGLLSARGLATLEAAACLVVFLPLALAAAAIAGLTFDQSTAESVTYNRLRETQVIPLEWSSDGGIKPRRSELDAAVNHMAAGLLADAGGRLSFSRSRGAAACYEVHQVDALTGVSIGVLEGRCSASGAALPTQVDAALSSARLTVWSANDATRVIGIPALGSNERGRYLPLAVLYRVAVWGRGPVFGFDSNVVWSHRWIVPRQEVQL